MLNRCHGIHPIGRRWGEEEWQLLSSAFLFSLFFAEHKNKKGTIMCVCVRWACTIESYSSFRITLVGQMHTCIVLSCENVRTKKRGGDDEREKGKGSGNVHVTSVWERSLFSFSFLFTIKGNKIPVQNKTKQNKRGLEDGLRNEFQVRQIRLMHEKCARGYTRRDTYCLCVYEGFSSLPICVVICTTIYTIYESEESLVLGIQQQK